MDVMVALAFATFENAPKEVTDAATKYSDNFLKMKKAESEVSKWNKEKKAAAELNDGLLKTFTQALDRWDPAKLNDTTPTPMPAVEVP